MFEECEEIYIENLTPHKIVVYDSAGERVILEIEPSGKVARVTTTQREIGRIKGVPIVKTEFGEVMDLPAPKKCTAYVVSTLVLNALKGKRPDVIAPDTSPQSAVRDEEGRIKGIRRFQVV